MTVAEFTPVIHERSTWEDPFWPVDQNYSKGGNKRSGKPARVQWDKIDTNVPHYTAADNLIDGDPGEFASDLPAYFRSIQRSYTISRGYSVGYNFFVDWLGGIWVGRGWDIQCAANLDHNTHTISILCLVDGDDTTTPEANRSIRWLVEETRRRAKRTTQIIGHGQLQDPNHPTGCPGAGIRNLISLDVYEPNNYDDNDTPSFTGDDMSRIITPTDGDNKLDIAIFTVTGTFAEWVSDQNDANAQVLLGISEHDGGKGTPPAVAIGIDRGFLKQFTLIGAAPIYPPDYAGVKTSPADFRRWVS